MRRLEQAKAQKKAASKRHSADEDLGSNVRRRRRNAIIDDTSVLLRFIDECLSA